MCNITNIIHFWNDRIKFCKQCNKMINSETYLLNRNLFVNVLCIKWAASWQNQQSDYAPSEDSDQPGHPPSLIRVFAVRMKKAWVLSYQLSAQRRLIRLGGCPGWSESSLGAHSFCWFCHEVAQIQCHSSILSAWSVCVSTSGIVHQFWGMLL